MSFPHRKPPPPQHLHKAGGGGVHHHRPQGAALYQSLQVVGVLLVGFLPSGLAGAVVVLLQPVPDPVLASPKAHRGGVHRPVVTRDVEGAGHIQGRLPHQILREEVVHQALCVYPLPQHKPAVEGSLEQGAVALQYGGGEAGVVRHGEGQAQRLLFLCFLNPLLVKPVGGALRVAGEPQLAPLHRAPGAHLLHKGAGHQSHLVQQSPRQGDALYQGGGALIQTAEEVEGVAAAAHGDGELMQGAPFPAGEAQLSQNGQQLAEEVAPHRGDGLAAQGEGFSLKAAHGPAEEGQTGAKGLAAAHRPVAEDGLVVLEGRAGPPPGEHPPLFFGED